MFSAQPEYFSGKIVRVEVDISRGMHSFSIVGMVSKAVDEARDRVNSALKNSGYPSPKSQNEKLVVSLAPAELKKEGAYHDIAIALAYLLASDEFCFNPKGKLFIGELSLDARVQPLTGILPIVQAAVDAGFSEIFVPYDNKEEAALVKEIKVFPVKSLKQLVNHLDKTTKEYIQIQKITEITKNETDSIIDFIDVRGQSVAKRGLEIAAAGGHNVCMFGPPGTGKTMLARAFSSILPSLNNKTILEVTGIHSVAGNLRVVDMIKEPPFRTPHHTSSYVAVVGGGSNLRPGEITLAHRGVLFLDEFPEFDKKVLESLRQPMEDRVITISRAKGTVHFPAHFILVAAMNPCPCGFYGSSHGVCICSAHDIARYKKKISGPIIDRIDIWLPVEHIEYKKLNQHYKDPNAETSRDIYMRVEGARTIQSKRLGEARLNSDLLSRDLQREYLSKEVSSLLNESAQKMNLSPRAYHKVLKLARTIADLEQSIFVESRHILEALQYRPQMK